MSQVEKISIALPSYMIESIKEAVESGAYATTSEVIRDAMRDWQYKRALSVYGLAELQRMVQEGIDSGPSVSIEDVRSRLKARLLQQATGATNEKRKARSARRKGSR